MRHTTPAVIDIEDPRFPPDSHQTSSGNFAQGQWMGDGIRDLGTGHQKIPLECFQQHQEVCGSAPDRSSGKPCP